MILTCQLATTASPHIILFCPQDMKAGGVEEDIQLSVENAISCHAVALLTHLRCTHTKANVTVANIHTEFDNFVHPDKKCIQVYFIFIS